MEDKKKTLIDGKRKNKKELTEREREKGTKKAKQRKHVRSSLGAIFGGSWRHLPRPCPGAAQRSCTSGPTAVFARGKMTTSCLLSASGSRGDK